MKNRLMGVYAAVLVASSCMAVPAYAALQGPSGPGTVGQIPEGYDEEAWARLEDNILEYDELTDLVRNFNPNMVNANYVYNDSVDSMRNIADLSYKTAGDLKETLDTMKKVPDHMQNEEFKQNLAMLTETYKILKKSADSTSRSVELMKRPTASGYSGIKMAEKQLVSAAQQLMIGYSTAVSQKAMLEKLKELNFALYEIAQVQTQVGMATQTELLSAQKGLLAAESSLTGLNNNIDSLRRSLCLMTGWTADANPDIRPVPDADLARIEAINLEEDTATAIANNYTLISERHNKGTSTSGKNKKLRSVSEGEQQLTIKMEALYQDILQKKAAYDSAQTAYEKAELVKNASDIQYQTGQIGKAAYLGQQLAYLQAKSNKNSANLALFQAMQTYDWAVDGIVELD